ncbi:MAG: hypothetical protein M9936_28625 [Caldilinea sp.]|nr:hypothetical protein [Caldilinea sp.]
MANAADALKAIAPTIATALGGPLAGLAVDALGAAFGWTDATKEKVESVLTSGQMSGEQIAQLKAAEIALQQRLAELKIDLESIDQKDRASARDRQSATKDGTNTVLAYLIICSFIWMVALMLLGYASCRDLVLGGTLVGYLSAKAEQVLAYYFGSTRGSAMKTELLAKAGQK